MLYSFSFAKSSSSTLIFPLKIEAPHRRQNQAFHKIDQSKLRDRRVQAFPFTYIVGNIRLASDRAFSLAFRQTPSFLNDPHSPLLSMLNL